MRFVSYESGGRFGVAVQDATGGYRGCLIGDEGFPGTLDEIVRSGEWGAASAMLLAAAVLNLDSVKVLPPFRRAGKILCVGLNYADHARESAMLVPDFPTVFARFNSGLVGHGAPIVRPRSSDKLDFEGEMVAVIGTGGKDIPEERALEHVAGYSIFNDGSIRDFQLRTPQWTVGKNFDGTGGFGPVFVTSDELPEGGFGLGIETRLNGEVMQRSNTKELIFGVRKLIALLSSAMTLEAGDLIVTGTPAGVGAARKPPVFMKPGDICEVEIEGIGVLRNHVVAQ
jgi:2-keto-4-pentenoate hydratase/2-oxohepta-3-ene-1,7-dioic acid hydratase in catechol pathway